jgi:glutamate synthase domain-containing protein 3
MPTFDLSISSLRELNNALHQVEEGNNDIHFDIRNARGHHAVAVGISAHLTVDIKGSVGYLCRHERWGRYRHPRLGGPGVAENIMSGTVVVEGDASQYAGATDTAACS